MQIGKRYDMAPCTGVSYVPPVTGTPVLCEPLTQIYFVTKEVGLSTTLAA
jgi:hypothetical protein